MFDFKWLLGRVIKDSKFYLDVDRDIRQKGILISQRIIN